jgi:hypothetical protein
MATHGIEFNDKVKSFRCPHCGKESMTVWGRVSKDNTAHAAYFANLMTGHQEISARLTIASQFRMPQGNGQLASL